MNNTKRNIVYITFSLFMLIILSFSIVSFFSSDTLSEITYVKWDGKEVASSFSGGNGTEVNPYRITTGGELMHFKKIVEESETLDKYYELDANIDLDNHEITPIGTVDKHFKGTFNGNGFNITNVNIKEGVEIDEAFYFGLFSKIEGNINNLNINKMTITPDNDNALVLGSLTGSLEDKSVVKNVSIQEIDVYLTDTLENDNSNISLFSGIVGKDNEINNISVFGKYYSSYSKNVSIISNKIDSSISNLVYKVDYEDEIKTNGVEEFNNIGKELEKDENNDKEIEFKNIYHFIDKDKVVLDETEYKFDKVIEEFNKELEDYHWSFEDKFIINKGKLEVEDNNINTNIGNIKGPSIKSFSFTPSGAIALHDSGISTADKTVYINDLTSDYNYYMGLNYTGGGTVSSTPTGNSYNLYSDSNLAKVYIAYRGHSIDNTTDVGYVSLSEQISDFVYYKYYPVDNGYINIPLIDNPYADRPNDLAFNGWMTDYSGAVVSYDAETYTRYVKIPTASSPISITMYATWTEATVINASVNNNNLVTTGLKSVGMYPLVSRRADYSGSSLPTLYTRGSVTSGANAYGSVNYPDGAVNEYGNSLNYSTCDPIVTGNGWNRRYTANTCYYYMRADNDNLDTTQTYYYIGNNGRMAVYNLPDPAGYIYERVVPVDGSVAGFYKKHTNTGSLVGYYNNQGVQYTSGSCTRNCEYYELVQFSETNVMTEDDYDVYYYLATRDTNIAFLVADIRGFTNSIPVTVTGINNGVDHSNYEIETNTRSIRAGADLRVEYANVNRNSYSTSTNGPSDSNTNYIYGEYHNLKIGRGIPIDTTTTTEWQYINGRYQQVQVTRKYLTANAVVGGSSDDTGTTPVKYNLIVESGYYNTLSAVSTTGSSADYYTNAVATYGCDFDRVNNADNSKLGVYYTAASSWGGYVRSGSTTELFSTQIVKSGKFGEVQSEAASGIYAGGLNGGTIYSPARLIVEGGDIFNINGGPLISSNNKALNMIYINMKGGEADFIFGGAALTTTYGNRIINVTGGTINYSVFGGSNGVNGGNGDGTLDGDSFIYIGGNAQIGDDTSADPVWGAEAGSVFGIGNGNSSYDTIGSANNSNIVIGGSAVIKKNVYGGGNYGGVGRSGNGSTTMVVVITMDLVQLLKYQLLLLLWMMVLLLVVYMVVVELKV